MGPPATGALRAHRPTGWGRRNWLGNWDPRHSDTVLRGPAVPACRAVPEPDNHEPARQRVDALRRAWDTWLGGVQWGEGISVHSRLVRLEKQNALLMEQNTVLVEQNAVLTEQVGRVTERLDRMEAESEAQMADYLERERKLLEWADTLPEPPDYGTDDPWEIARMAGERLGPDEIDRLFGDD
jgi:hypothetical protein